MNTSVPVQPAGSVPAFGNLYVTLWSLINLLIPLAIAALIIWYFKKQNDDKKQLLQKLDTLISLQQNKNTEEK